MSNYSSTVTAKLSYQAIIEKANSKIKILGEVKEVTKSKVSQTPAYPLFNIPEGKDMSDKEMVAKLSLIQKLSTGGKTKGKLVNVLQTTKSLKIPSAGATWKFSLPDARHRPDTSMYNKLMAADLKEYAEASFDLYRSNGTKKALCERLSDKLTVDGPTASIRITNLTLKDVHVYENQLSGDSAILHSLNQHASAGLPYAFYPVKNSIPKVTDLTNLPITYLRAKTNENVVLLEEPIPVLEHALNVAKIMFNEIIAEADSFRTTRDLMTSFFQLHPELNTFIVKRKDEKMERVEWNKKVRPYGAQPLPTRLLSMWAIKPLEDNLNNFIEDPQSISAYHYSHYHGGSDKIIDYFANKMKENFSGLAYGDDQLWQVVLEGGDVVLLAPDVSAMDMSTTNACVPDIIRFILDSKSKMPDINIRALYFSLQIAFGHDIHLGGPYILSKIHSLISGIPGTTIINIANSARIQTILKDHFVSPTKKTFFKQLNAGLADVKAKLGYSFKGLENLAFDAPNDNNFDKTMMKYSEFMVYTNPSVIREKGIPLPFLSQIIQPYTMVGKTRLVSLPKNLLKLGATLILPDSYSTKGREGDLKTLERIAGAYFSGGWADQKFSDFLHRQYKALSSDVFVDFGVSDINSIGELDVVRISKFLTGKGLPSRQFMFDFNTLSYEEFSTLYTTNPGVIYDDEILFQKPAIKANTSKASSSTSTVDADDLDVLDQLAGFDKNKIVDIKKAGNFNANTKSQEEKKLLRRKAHQQRRALTMEIMSLVPSKKKRDKYTEIIQRIYEGEMDAEARSDLATNLHDSLAEDYSDADLDTEALDRLAGSSESFYKSWDDFEYYEALESEMLEEEDNIDEEPDEVDQLDEYAISDRGKMEYGIGNIGD